MPAEESVLEVVGGDEPSVGDQAEAADTEAVGEVADDERERRRVARVAGEHVVADRDAARRRERPSITCGRSPRWSRL